MLLVTSHPQTGKGSIQYYIGLEAIWMIHDMVVSTEVEELNDLLHESEEPSNLLKYIEMALKSDDVALIEMSTMFLSNAMERKETAVMVTKHVPIFDILYQLLQKIDQLDIYTLNNILSAISRLSMN